MYYMDQSFIENIMIYISRDEHGLLSFNYS